MTTKPVSNAALLRKIARLEAQLQAANEFVARMSQCDIATVMLNADLKERMRQAAVLLVGGDA